ncbi:MAG: hypothetical protein LUC88_00250 [Prevotella sp.]|nr:hypothetical protein [Prevotella sp.]
MSEKDNITVIDVPVKHAPCPCGVAGYGTNETLNSSVTSYQDTSTVFEEDGRQVTYLPLTIKRHEYQYVPFGERNLLPYEIRDRISANMVTSQCQLFNVIACYGQGLRFVDRQTKEDVDNEEISKFCLANSLTETFLEQATDMKYFFFSVTVIILNKKGDKIVMVRNKDAMNCRFEYAPSTQSGEIEHVFYGDFRDGHFEEDKIEVIPLLDFWNPLGDLNYRMGLEPNWKTGEMAKPTQDRKFAIVSRMATPGCQYYPMPYYISVFKDHWYDIYELIGMGKKHLIRNTSAPRIQIEVHNEYWDNLCDVEGIIDEAARRKRKEDEKQKLIDYCTGVLNAGKAIVSGYWVDPNGKENRMVRINVLNDKKTEGGDWSDDMSEASNALCFAFGVHPNLVGATPGKSQMNNSGSDKRELFTLKQAMEKPFHDVMCKPYHVILHFNKWNTFATVDVPMIQLTTLDENKDSKKVSNSNGKEEESDD